MPQKPKHTTWGIQDVPPAVIRMAKTCAAAEGVRIGVIITKALQLYVSQTKGGER